MRIAVFSTYDVTPGENGGETRFLNLYRRLSRTEEVRILAYDLRCGVPIRRVRLDPALDTFTAGVSPADREAFAAAADRLGLYPHDVLCIATYQFSAAFLGELHAALAWAQIVVVTTPFLSELVFPLCRSGQLKLYEAHNIELHAKAQYFAAARDTALAAQLLDATVACERLAVECADIVLAVSEDDAAGFAVEYDVSRSKIHLVPNGVSVAAFDAVPLAARQDFRRTAGLAAHDVGVFLGSSYGPNIDSYRLSRQWLDEAGFGGSVLILGRIAEAFDASWPRIGFTEHWLGFVDDAVKHLLIGAADFAIQIVVSGGGTNLKLFDYMAAGIPILANAFGSRGVAEDGWFIPVDSADAMLRVVAARQWRSEPAAQAARAARGIALREFDWNEIAARYRAILA